MKEFEKYEITVSFKDEEIPIEVGVSSFIIGRSPKAEVSLAYDLISREHLKITLNGENVFIEELGSSNGTWLNGNKLKTKIKYIYENDCRLILGNIKGPVVLIKCLFKEKVKVKVKEIVIEDKKNKEDLAEIIFITEKDEIEEITQVKENPLVEQSTNENKVIVMRSDFAEKAYLVERPLAKVANGSYVSSDRPSLKPQMTQAKPSPDRSDKSLIEPNLLLQMKNILSMEAQKASKASQKEAEDIKAASHREAGKVVSDAQNEALIIKQKIQEEVKDSQIRSKNEIEQNRLNAARKIDLLLSEAQNEADNIIKKANFEVDKVRMAVKNKSDELIEVASKRAKDLALNARKSAEEITQKARKEADDFSLLVANENAELKLFSSKESAAIHLSAQVLSEEIISKAHEKATKHLKDSEYIIQIKLDESLRIEDENRKNIQKLNDVFQELKLKTETLKQLEFEAQSNYNSLTKGFEKEQVRISIERTSLEELRMELSGVKNKLEKKISDLRLEEKNASLQFETTLLEHKVQVAQTVSEVQQAQMIKENLGLEISFLKNEKEKVDRIVKDVELDLIHRNLKIEQISKDETNALNELNKTKELKNEILAEISKEKNDLIISKEKLSFEEKEVAEKIKNVQEYSDKTAAKIKQDYADFESKKTEMVNQFQTAKNKQVKDLENELEQAKLSNSNEITILFAKRDQAILDCEKAEKESLLTLQMIIDKNKQETQVIQKVHRDEIEKQRINTQNRLNLMKEKFNQISIQVTKEHDEFKKTLKGEISELTTSKNSIEKELRFIESKRQERISAIDQEVNDHQLTAKKKMDSITNKINEETVELKKSLAKIKEDELKALSDMRENEIVSLTLLKESTMKDLHGKKSEKAKAITTNVGAMVLTHLNTFRNRKINDVFIEICSKNINDIIYDTLMNRIEGDREKLDQAIKTKDSIRKKSILMKKGLAWTIFLLVLVSIGVFYPQLQAMPEFRAIKTFIDENILNKF